MARDPYDVLGLGSGASSDDAKRAYKRLARKYHPDLNPHSRDAAARFREVADAYRALSSGETFAPPRSSSASSSTSSARGSGRASQRTHRAERPPGGKRSGATVMGSRFRYRREPDAFDPDPGFAGSDEPDFIVRAQIQGFALMGSGALAAAVMMPLVAPIGDGDMTLGSGLVAFGAAVTLASVATSIVSRLTASWSAEDALAVAILRSIPTLFGAGAGLLLLAFISDIDVSPQAEVAAAIGGGSAAYLVGRLWDRTSVGFSIVSSALVAGPFGAFVAFAVAHFQLFLNIGRRYRLESTNELAHFPSAAAAVLAGVAGGLLGAYAVALVRFRSRSGTHDVNRS